MTPEDKLQTAAFSLVMALFGIAVLVMIAWILS